MLTVLTAAHRNPEGLKSLYREIGPGLSETLQWVVQDSGACPDSRAFGDGIDCPHVSFKSAPDDGIYDALNRGLVRVRTPYYLVVGSDDTLALGPLQTIAASLRDLQTTGPDILTYPVLINGRIRQRQPWWPAQVNILGLTASHSVGTVIRRSLHDRLGPYDCRYRILADSLFLRRAQLAGARFEHCHAPVPGAFSTGGISHTRRGRLLVENYSYNLECGSARWLQTVMMGIRMIAYRPRSLL